MKIKQLARATSHLIFFTSFITAFAKDTGYLKADTTDISKAKIAVIYSTTPGGNLPGASLVFPDGTKIALRPVCEGDYAWCIRPNDNSSDTGWIEVGSLKIDLDKTQNMMHIAMKIDDKTNYNKFKKYLDSVTGAYKKTPLPVSQIIANWKIK